MEGMKKYAIIVAGGSGSRMKSDLPKQFLCLKGLPLLMHTLRAFEQFSGEINRLLVLPRVQLDTWSELCRKHGFESDYRLVEGGETRFHSVQKGLDAIAEKTGLVAVHDGVRPLVSPKLIASGYKVASEYGSAIASVPLKDSIRQQNPEGGWRAADRDAFRMVQTPQTFRLDWIKEAFRAAYRPLFTDCASVVEHAGFPIRLIEGAYTNIKITTPEDLVMAEAFWGAAGQDDPVSR